MLVVVDRHDDDAVVGQQVPRQLQPRVHHAEPVGVESTVRLGVRDESVARRRLTWPELREVVGAGLGEVVVVDEVVAGVVRRVDVDELDLAEVRLLEQLQRVEVVALDEEVLRRVEVDRLLAHRAERLGDRRVGGERGGALAGPVELVALLRPFDDVVGQLLAEQVEVDRPRPGCRRRRASR